MEAPANVLPLHPKSALPEQRHLLLVHEHPSPPRGTPASEAVCRRGRHPLTPRGWKRVPQRGWQGTAAEPPELPRAWAAHSKHRQTLSVEQEGVCLITLPVSCAILIHSFTQEPSLNLTWLPTPWDGCGWPEAPPPQGLPHDSRARGSITPSGFWHRLPPLQGDPQPFQAFNLSPAIFCESVLTPFPTATTPASAVVQERNICLV